MGEMYDQEQAARWTRESRDKDLGHHAILAGAGVPNRLADFMAGRQHFPQVDIATAHFSVAPSGVGVAEIRGWWSNLNDTRPYANRRMDWRWTIFETPDGYAISYPDEKDSLLGSDQAAAIDQLVS